MSEMPEGLLSSKEIIEQLRIAHNIRISFCVLYKAIELKKLPAQKVDRIWGIKLEDAIKFVHENPTVHIPKPIHKIEFRKKVKWGDSVEMTRVDGSKYHIKLKKNT